MDMEKLAAALAPVILAEVQKATEPLEREIAELKAREPANGKDGRDGVDGKDAEPVSEDAITLAVAKHLKANPPADGKDGADGANGRDGIDGQNGKDGESVSVAEVSDAVAAQFERRFADLSLSWERQARDLAEKAIDRMPKPQDGAAGADGRDFAQPEFEYDGRRTFTMRVLENGEQVERSFTLPVVIDAGFYREGDAYEKGDGVTFGGSYWIAQKDTGTKPMIGNDDWRLAVKKGRDASSKGRA